jgi:hypothetical protein
MSYENYDVMLLLNTDEWGYDFDSNIFQATLQTGLMISAGGSMPNNLHLILKLAWAQAPAFWKMAAVPGAHGNLRTNQYGEEVDFTARWYVNKNASLYWSMGYLADCEIISAFNRHGSDYAWISLLGFQVGS